MADLVLDFHSGGKTLDFLPFCAAHVLPDKAQEARGLAAVEAFAAPYSVKMLEIDNVGMLDTTAEGLGKTFVTTELGGGGTARAATVAIARRGVRNVLRHAGILAGAPEPAPTQWLDMPSADCFVFAEDDGLIEPIARPRRPGRSRRPRRPHPPGRPHRPRAGRSPRPPLRPRRRPPLPGPRQGRRLRRRGRGAAVTDFRLEGVDRGRSGPGRCPKRLSLSLPCLEDDIPAVARRGARDQDQAVRGEKRVAEGLLVAVRGSRVQPVRVRDVLRSDHVDQRRIGDARRGEDVRLDVEGPETLVDGDLDRRGRRVERGVDHANSGRVPAAADPEAAFADRPCLGVALGVDAPETNLAVAQRRRQRRHV